MSSRTVSVVLTAQVQNYLTNMRAAENATRELDARTKTVTETLRAQQAQLQKHNQALHAVGVGLLAVGATAAAGLGLAIKASAEFGAKMAQLQSLSHASAGTMKLAADAAMSVGTAYGFSATQVADAQIELQKAGIGIKAQLGGALVGALSLAAAGQMDVAQATEITTVAMTQFGLKAAEVPHVADLLAAGADKALGSVADLGEALKNGGLQASNMGMSIDQTVGLLSAFANAGILGAEAGTQMRSMFLRLQNPTQEAKDVLDKYGISINDASGHFVGMTRLAGELSDNLGKLDPATRNAALAQVFGSHAIVGATAVYNLGSKGVQGWNDRVQEAGFASAQAAGKMNSLQGDVQKLGAAFQTDLIKSGTGANEVLRNLAHGAAGALDVIGGIPAPLLSAGVGLTALVAGVGLVGGAALIAVPKVLLLRDSMRELGISGRATAGMIGKGGALLTGIMAVGSGFAATAMQGEASAQQVTRSAQVMSKHWKGLGDLFKGDGGFFETGGFAQALKDEQYQAGSAKFLDGLTFGITHFSDVYKQNEGAFGALGQQLAGLSKQNYRAAASSFSDLVTKYKLGADEQKRLLATMPAYRDALVALAGKAHIAATDQNILAIALGKGKVGQQAAAAAAREGAAAAAKQAGTLATLSGQASAATVNIDDLQKTIEGFGSAQLDARAATRSMYSAIDAATAAAAKNGHTLDVHTQAGRDNAAALDAIASAADTAASKTLKQTGSAEKAKAVMQEGRDAFVKAATAMTGSSKEAERLANKLGLIPHNIDITVKGTGFDPALIKAKQIRDAMNNLDGTTADVYVNAVAHGLTTGQAAQVAKNSGLGRAEGGAIDGPGPRGVDSVPALLAPGEHVLTAREVEKMGGQGGVYAFRAAVDRGDVQHFAKGGAVRPKAPAPDLGAVQAQKDAAAAAKRAAATAQKAVDAAAKRRKVQEKAAKDAHTALTKAQDAAAKISGKGTAAAKHAATLHTRDLAKKAKAADDRVKATQKRIDASKKTRDDARQKQADAEAAAQTLREGREDFVSGQRRATPSSPIDPISYVDQLRQMSRDDNFSAGRRESMDATANQYEASLVKLQTASAAAAEKLDTLKTSSVQLHDSVASAISGGYSLSGAAQRQTTSGWINRDGMRFQTTGGGATASSIAGYYQAGAGTARQFAAALTQLAGRGLNAQLLAELAGMGTEQGLPIAQAILSGSDADLQSINGGYSAIAAAAGQAGTTAADANYAAQIAAADANAAEITQEIATQGEALRKIIAQAFGLKGYATGTRSATPGLHWVGEHGPELLGFAGGEAVLNAADSRRWVRGGAGAAAAPQVSVNTPPVRMPDTITVQDLHGFTATMRTVASQEIARDAAHDAVLTMGGAA